MKPFARIIESEKYGQILTVIDTNDDQEPIIKFTFDPQCKSLGLVESATVIDDTDEGVAAAHEYVMGMTTKQAEKWIEQAWKTAQEFQEVMSDDPDD